MPPVKHPAAFFDFQEPTMQDDEIYELRDLDLDQVAGGDGASIDPNGGWASVNPRSSHLL